MLNFIRTTNPMIRWYLVISLGAIIVFVAATANLGAAVIQLCLLGAGGVSLHYMLHRALPH